MRHERKLTEVYKHAIRKWKVIQALIERDQMGKAEDIMFDQCAFCHDSKNYPQDVFNCMECRIDHEICNQDNNDDSIFSRIEPAYGIERVELVDDILYALEFNLEQLIKKELENE